MKRLIEQSYEQHYRSFKKMFSTSFARHCVLGFFVRFSLIVYSNFHDSYFAVPYTDIDYKVYTDASRFILQGKSPYDRHTYRYTPLLALLLTPNIILHSDFGKLLFSVVDVIITILMRNILQTRGYDERVSKNCALTWLYNPLTIVISTRGNADALAVLSVLSMLHYLQKGKPILSGLVHGLSIHFRLYPIAFSLSMYLSLRGKNYFLPTFNQLKLVLSCLISLIFLTSTSYYFYGYKYIYESTIYHLIRKDARHNFSLFFYMTYLSTGQSADVVKRLVAIVPQLLVIVVLSLRYSTKKELPFAMLTQAIVMVTYNPVMTSQYFFWFLSILPICLPNIRMSARRWCVLGILWISGQSLWLFNAYLLEFKSVNTFYDIWIAGILFFIVNLKILQDIIHHYTSRVTILDSKNE